MPKSCVIKLCKSHVFVSQIEIRKAGCHLIDVDLIVCVHLIYLLIDLHLYNGLLLVSSSFLINKDAIIMLFYHSYN